MRSTSDVMATSINSQKTYQASPLWTLNIIATVITAFVGFPILTLVLFVALKQHHASAQMLFGLAGLFGGSTLLVFVAYFPGNLGVFYPYRVEVHGTDITLYAPFKKVHIPASEIGDIENSFPFQGHVVRLTRPKAALTQFVISWLFGSERRAALDAIRLAAEKANQSMS